MGDCERRYLASLMETSGLKFMSFFYIILFYNFAL